MAQDASRALVGATKQGPAAGSRTPMLLHFLHGADACREILSAHFSRELQAGPVWDEWRAHLRQMMQLGMGLRAEPHESS